MSNNLINIDNFYEGFSTMDQLSLLKNKVTNALYLTNNETKTRIEDFRLKPFKRNVPPSLQKDDLAFSVKVEYAYNIPIEYNYMHPMVRVSFVNLDSGELLEVDSFPYQKNCVFGQEEEWCYTQIKSQTGDKQLVIGEMSADGKNSSKVLYPVLTNPKDLRETSDRNPKFEEEFVFNLKTRSIIENKCVIFFELVDYNLEELSNKDGSELYNVDDDGFRLMAWSYVIPNGESSFHLSEKKLQFYQYSFDKNFRMKNRPKIPLVFYSFNYPIKHELDSYLRVKLGYFSVNEYVKDYAHKLRSTEPLCVFHDYVEDERKTLTWEYLYREFCGEEEQEVYVADSNEDSFERLLKVKRIWNYHNMKPNYMEDKVVVNHEDFSGCYRVKFSNFGKFAALVFPSHSGENYIVIYNVFDKTIKYNTIAHQGLINDIKWSSDDEYILTASSDQTCKVFRTFCGKSEMNIEDKYHKLNCYATMMHPSYVYSACFDPSKLFFDDKAIMVVTVCADGYIRFFRVCLSNLSTTNNFSTSFQPEVVKKLSLQDIYYRNEELRGLFLNDLNLENESADKIYFYVQNILEEKKIYPNSMTFDTKKFLYIGDSYGVIHILNCDDLDSIDSRKVWRSNNASRNYIYENSYIDQEMMGDKITQITYLDNDPEENKFSDEISVYLGHCLIVQSNDNAIRLLKIDQELIQNKYVGIKAQKYAVRHTTSPDAKYLVSGSEDGRVMMWDIVTGLCEDTNYTLESTDPVIDVDWNKKLNMVAIVQYGLSNSCLFFAAYNQVDGNEKPNDVYQETINDYYKIKEANQIRKRRQRTDLDDSLERMSNASHTPMRDTMKDTREMALPPRGKKLNY